MNGMYTGFQKEDSFVEKLFLFQFITLQPTEKRPSESQPQETPL